MLSEKHRNIAFEKGIRRWDDKRCKIHIFNMKNSPTSNLIEKILKINQQQKDLIRPSKIKDNTYNWNDVYPTDFYIDYETISEPFFKLGDDINIYNSSGSTTRIFMIGVGYVENGTFKFKEFHCKNFTSKDETELVDSFKKFIMTKKKRITLL